MESIEILGKFNQRFDETIVEDTLTQIDSLIEDKMLLNIENFHLKMRLFCKLKEEVYKYHATNQADNYFTEGSWKYVGENLSRKI